MAKITVAEQISCLPPNVSLSSYSLGQHQRVIALEIERVDGPFVLVVVDREIKQVAEITFGHGANERVRPDGDDAVLLARFSRAAGVVRQRKITERIDLKDDQAHGRPVAVQLAL
jgi:hypothetical protein